MDFNKAFALLMVNECGSEDGGKTGGYVNDPNDAGGETKYGISKAAYPAVDIANLTLEGAQAIYLSDYWNLNKCDKMPWAIGWVVFDCAVNHGPKNAARFLQIALNVPADGNMGPQTLNAAGKAKQPLNVARDMTLARRDFVEELHNYDHFKNGWNRRHLDTLIGAAVWGA